MSPTAHRSHPRAICFVAPIVLLFAVISVPLGMMAAPLEGVRAGYDPMAVAAGFTPKTVDLVVKDTSRQRDIPIRSPVGST